jgi:rubrerythrin
MNEITNIRDAIKTAIQMEKEGLSFYQKAAAQTTSNMGRTIFKSLAADELLHLETFQKLFDKKIGKEDWNDLVNTSNKYIDIQIFPKDLKRIAGEKPNINEIDALRIAMDNEKKAIDFYLIIKEKNSDEETNKIIDKIIQQEKSHYQILESEFNHINETGYWFDLDYLGPR